MRKMKDSGIEWVGQIPEHWEIEKGKYILQYLQKPVKDEDEVITCFRDGEVTLRSNRREEGFTISEKEIGYQGIDVGDLVVHGMDGFAGSIGISDSRGKASPVLNVLDSVHNKRYLMYYLRSMAYGNVFLALATGIRVRSCDLRWNKLAVLPFPVPPVYEQNSIADFLDSKCADIDSLVNDIEKQIATLDEYKKSIITEAVTKGLNPDVEMKDSGIANITTIPNSWSVVRLKYLCDIATGDEDTQNSDSEGEYPFYVRSPIIERCRRYTFEGEGILVAGDGAGAGRIFHHAFGKYAVHQRVYRLYNFNCCSRYLYYYLSALFPNEMDKGSAQSTVPSMRLPMLLNFDIYMPATCEQQQIADYLGSRCFEIDSLVADKKKQLEILKEYKKSLIYECVTGKIDCRDM